MASASGPDNRAYRLSTKSWPRDSSAPEGRVRLAAHLPELRRGAPRRAALDRVVQRAASAPGTGLSQPAPIPSAAGSACGLTPGASMTTKRKPPFTGYRPGAYPRVKSVRFPSEIHVAYVVCKFSVRMRHPFSPKMWHGLRPGPLAARGRSGGGGGCSEPWHAARSIIYGSAA